MKPTPPENYRDAYPTPQETHRVKALLDHCFDNGVMLINTCSGTLSTPMTGNEIDTLTEVLHDGFHKLKEIR